MAEYKNLISPISSEGDFNILSGRNSAAQIDI